MALVIKKNLPYEIDSHSVVQVKEMGNITQVMYSAYRNHVCSIRLVDKDHYYKLDTRTGECISLLTCNHINNRAESLFQVSQSLKRLRDYINTNVVNPNHWKWITLTYGENMQDTKKLYSDFQRFIRALRNKYNKYKIEYIVACEPQGRGAWHLHVLVGFGKVAPYISNKIIWSLWSPNGPNLNKDFTKTQKVTDIDNVGAYLTAYLADIELNDTNISILKENGCKASKKYLKEQTEIKSITIDGKSKKYIKGGRLYMYPPNFNLYRFSRGIKKPIVSYMDYFDAKIKVGFCKQPTFKQCSSVEDLQNGFKNIYVYEYYNKLR